MTSDQFRELCRGACRQLNESDTDAFFEGHGVLIDGVRLGVVHNEHIDPAGIYCCADLGEIGHQAEAARVMEELLALNLELNVARSETIGLERETRHLVLRARLAADGEGEPLHEGFLAEQLRYYAGEANHLYEKVLVGIERPD